MRALNLETEGLGRERAADGVGRACQRRSCGLWGGHVTPRPADVPFVPLTSTKILQQGWKVMNPMLLSHRPRDPEQIAGSPGSCFICKNRFGF